MPAPEPVWTVIVVSLSIEAGYTDRDADAEAEVLRAAGQPASVLLSSFYRNLRPGYWVVSSGRFRTRAEAQAHAATLQALGYVDAYPRSLER